MKEIEILLRKLILRILLLFSGKKASEKLVIDKPQKVLVIRLNKIGDALVLTPLLSALRKNVPHQITVLADKKNHFVFRNNPDVNEVILFEKGIGNFIKLLRRINNNFDIILDSHDDVSTTVSFIIALARLKHKFALKKENNILYTETIEKPDPSRYHVVERNMQLVRLFGMEVNEIPRLKFIPENSALEKASSFYENKISGKGLVAGINISAGSDARYWGTGRFKQLLLFITGYTDNIILFSDPSDRNKAEEIADGKYPVYNSESFGEFAAGLSKLQFLFTPDTSAVHIASANNIPVFGLYVKYNTNHIIWYPYDTEYEAVITEEPNFENLEFKIVLKKLKPFWEKIVNEQRNTEM